MNDERPPKMPGWVKWTLVVAVVVLLIAVAVMVFSGGEHGPWQHSLGAQPHFLADSW